MHFLLKLNDFLNFFMGKLFKFSRAFVDLNQLSINTLSRFP